jgi:hypothetical protein
MIPHAAANDDYPLTAKIESDPSRAALFSLSSSEEGPFVEPRNRLSPAQEGAEADERLRD